MNDHSNNNYVDEVDQAMGRLRGNFPTPEIESRLQQGMRQQWEELGQQPQTVAWPTHVLLAARRNLVATCSAAAALLLAPLVLYLLFNSQSVYAQVLAGIRNAQTVYAKGFDIRDGQETPSVEIWYDANRGVRENFGEEGIRIDDGQFEWMYHPETGTAIKAPSRDPIGQIAEVLDPVKAIDRYGGKRLHELDATFDGASCRAFVVSPYDNPQIRSVLWLDGRSRLIRFEEQRRGDDGAWALDERVDMRYDRPIPAERFVPSFPPGTRIVDRSVPLEGFELEDALASAERLGIVLAIHDVRRVDEDMVLVLSTSRASPDVVDRFGKIDSRRQGSKVYGEFMWGSNGRRMADNSWKDGMRAAEIASWRRNGVDFQWVLLDKVKSRGWLTEGNKLPVGFHVYTRSDWQEFLRDENKPTHLWNENDVVTLDVPVEGEGLDAILSDIHQQALSMGNGTERGSPWLQLKPIPWTKEEIEEAVAGGMSRFEAEKMLHGRREQPENISVEAWKAEVLEMLAD